MHNSLAGASDTAQNSHSFPGQLLMDPLCHTDIPRGTHSGILGTGGTDSEGRGWRSRTVGSHMGREKGRGHS